MNVLYERNTCFVDIYSKPVWGYIVAGIRRWLNAHIPELMIRTIDGTLTGKKQ